MFNNEDGSPKSEPKASAYLHRGVLRANAYKLGRMFQRKYQYHLCFFVSQFPLFDLEA
jgi:hypothetical protein